MKLMNTIFVAIIVICIGTFLLASSYDNTIARSAESGPVQSLLYDEISIVTSGDYTIWTDSRWDVVWVQVTNHDTKGHSVVIDVAVIDAQTGKLVQIDGKKTQTKEFGFLESGESRAEWFVFQEFPKSAGVYKVLYRARFTLSDGGEAHTSRIVTRLEDARG